MKANIITSKEINFSDIKIGDTDLQSILIEIHKETTQCVNDISLERQQDLPDFEDIDAPLHSVLNTILKLLKD